MIFSHLDEYNFHFEFVNQFVIQGKKSEKDILVLKKNISEGFVLTDALGVGSKICLNTI